jgi:uncharacterized protein DUF4184
MPFTPTHVLAILPVGALLRRLPLSALAVGSMIPDLPLFVPFLPGYAMTHSPVGIVTVCLPLGVAMLLAFQWIIKVPAISLFPTWAQTRMTSCSRPLLIPSTGFFFRVSLAVVLGAITHVVWDAFTHQGRWGTQLFPVLNQTTLILGWHVPGYKLFQYGSTIVALPVLTLLSALWLRRNAPAPTKGLYRFGWSAKLLSAGVTLAIPLVVTVSVMATSDGTFYMNVGQIIKTSGLLAMVTLIAYSLVFHVATNGEYVARLTL